MGSVRQPQQQGTRPVCSVHCDTLVMDDIRLEISQLRSCSTVHSSLEKVGVKAHLVCVHQTQTMPITTK